MNNRMDIRGRMGKCTSLPASYIVARHTIAK
jgi:hypothetical protein